jgi:hypothetical protein
MSLRIQDLRKGDRVTDKDDRYVCDADPVCIDGVWQIETTTGGDYIYMLKDDPDNLLGRDDWLERVKARRKK